MPAKELSPDQIADAKRLMAKFKAWQADRKNKDLPSSQEEMAQILGFKTQSAVTQYLNGKIPLSIESASKFATALDCRIEEISPALASRIADINSRTALAREVKAIAANKGDMFHAPTEEELEIFHDFLLLVGDDRDEAIKVIRTNAKRARAYSSPVLEKAKGKGKKTAAAQKAGSARTSAEIGDRLRQRSLIEAERSRDENDEDQT